MTAAATSTRHQRGSRRREQIPATVAEHYNALEKHASDCIGCGLCETRCPFHVRVAEHMKTVAGFFGK